MSGSTTDNTALYQIRDYLRDIAASTAGGGAAHDSAFRRSGHSTFNANKYRNDINLFDKAITKATNVVDQFHRTTDHVTSQMATMARGLFGGAAIAGVITGAANLGKTFNRMTDIGQSFYVSAKDLGMSMSDMADRTEQVGTTMRASADEVRGSMFEMARQASHAGLSLEQYTHFLTKNSTATAVAGAKAMGDLQLSVRNTLKPLGFYGMTLTQLDDMTSDYAETLRETGGLERLDSKQQSAAVQRLAHDVSGFAELTGKSREAILKDFNAAMRETSGAMRMAADGLSGPQQQAYQSFVSFFASLPGVAGQEMPKFFAQLYGTGGNAYFTEMGKTAITAGMPQLNAAMQKLMNVMQSGADDVSGVAVETAVGMKNEILRNQRQLQNLANAGGEAGAAAQKLLTLGQSLAGLDEKQMKAKLAQQKQLDAITQRYESATRDVMVFESNWEVLAGSFREGFFTSFAKAISSFDFTAGDKDTMEGFKAALKALGETVGTLLGAVFSRENLDFLREQLKVLSGSLASTVGDPKFKDGLQKFEQAIIDGGKWIAATLNDPKFKQGLMDFGNAVLTAGKMFTDAVQTIANVIGGIHKTLSQYVGPGIATGLMAGAFLFRKLIFSLFAGITSRLFGAFVGTATIRAGNVQIITGRGGGLGGGGGIGGAGPGGAGPGGAAGTRRGRWRRGALRAGGYIGGAIAGMVTSSIANSVMDYFMGGDSALKEVLATGVDVALTAGGTALGSKIVTPLIERLGGGVAKSTVEAAEEAAGDTAAKVATKEGEKVTEKVAAKTGIKAAVKLGGKAVMKSILKKIPLIGLGAGAMFAAQRAMAGDWTGAGLEMASGAAGTLPGFGTAGSVGIDTVLAARDAGLIGGGANDNQPVQPIDAGRLLQATPDTLSSMSTQDLQGRLSELNTLTSRDQAEEAAGRSTPELLAEIVALHKKQLEVSTILNKRNNDLTQEQISLTRDLVFTGAL